VKRVRIYTTTYCPYCRAAKALLESKGIAYEEVDLTWDPEEKIRVMHKTGWKTVPIIIIGEKLIGGYEQLKELERLGKLEELLA
jgi:glutaredoxin 3